MLIPLLPFADSHPPTKQELRSYFRQLRQQCSSLQREEQSQAIAQRFLTEIAYQHFKTIHCFLPIQRLGEINTWHLIHRLHHADPHISLVISKSEWETNTLHHYRWSPQMQLGENAWGIPEPLEHQLLTPISAKEIECIIVPLLCFDYAGYRVGYGKGFYDRFLSECLPTAQKIGVSAFPPVPKIADVQPFDMKLNACVDINQVWRF